MKNIQQYVTELPLEARTFFTLVEATARLIGQSEKYWASQDLNGARIRLLVEIAKSGGKILPSVLASRIGVTKANISLLMGPLEQLGYITIASDPEDGRKKTIVLSPEGESLLWEVLPGNRSVIATQMESLNDEEKMQLLALLGKLQKGTANQ
ncbi:MarR family winged helix-turn-helix transcriptional regulator [Cohnella herbarum]|uniref:MarR family transcriptional regulator n=1 Tax=Cohnella herbarum TaxID=2728023 RepID=A0A7Z2VML9_9BACL|nr:MarR family transcriptional regulator [Cohnella herbarum]QJD86096.1 MarR family transcriptional regulator [Cohnella herbarum]